MVLSTVSSLSIPSNSANLSNSHGCPFDRGVTGQIPAIITGSTCPHPVYEPALTLLVSKRARMDTLLTYHRTWETGVGDGHEGRRIQPFIVLFRFQT